MTNSSEPTPLGSTPHWALQPAFYTDSYLGEATPDLLENIGLEPLDMSSFTDEEISGLFER